MKTNKKNTYPSLTLLLLTCSGIFLPFAKGDVIYTQDDLRPAKTAIAKAYKDPSVSEIRDHLNSALRELNYIAIDLAIEKNPDLKNKLEYIKDSLPTVEEETAVKNAERNVLKSNSDLKNEILTANKNLEIAREKLYNAVSKADPTIINKLKKVRPSFNPEATPTPTPTPPSKDPTPSPSSPNTVPGGDNGNDTKLTNTPDLPEKE
jgi:hypothetical protein